MDWEIYERYRATLLLAGIALLTFLMMSFPQVPAVRNIKTFFVNASTPMYRVMAYLQGASTHPQNNDAQEIAVPLAGVDIPVVSSRTTHSVVFTPHAQSLVDENRRLRSLLALRERRWPRSVAARVVGRDPQRWFQELVIDKGTEEGVRVDDPVIAEFGTGAGLVGRIVDAEAHVSRVMLLQDSLSSVAATLLEKETEDGVVEGSDQHEVILKYLDRNSTVKIGDLVVTSGLGHRFPPGIPIGMVEDLMLDARQLFLQARLRPTLQGHALHYVLVLSDL